MSNKGILTKAIQKAIDNGFDRDSLIIWCNSLYSDGKLVDSYFPLIYNHDFAKALWGEEWSRNSKQFQWVVVKPYIFHLQQMVIADDPIKYLGENI